MCLEESQLTKHFLKIESLIFMSTFEVIVYETLINSEHHLNLFLLKVIRKITYFSSATFLSCSSLSLLTLSSLSCSNCSSLSLSSRRFLIALSVRCLVLSKSTCRNIDLSDKKLNKCIHFKIQEEKHISPDEICF